MGPPCMSCYAYWDESDDTRALDGEKNIYLWLAMIAMVQLKLTRRTVLYTIPSPALYQRPHSFKYGCPCSLRSLDDFEWIRLTFALPCSIARWFASRNRQRWRVEPGSVDVAQASIIRLDQQYQSSFISSSTEDNLTTCLGLRCDLRHVVDSMMMLSKAFHFLKISTDTTGQRSIQPNVCWRRLTWQLIRTAQGLEEAFICPMSRVLLIPV